MNQEPPNNTSNPGDRRENPRIKIQIWAEEKYGKDTYYHLLSNLSLTGLFIEKKLPFPADSEVNIDFQFPGTGEKINITGIVVSNYKDPASNNMGAGIKFISLDRKVKEKIEKYLKRSPSNK